MADVIIDTKKDSRKWCGVGPVPPGKVRGSFPYCAQTNQISFYGINSRHDAKLATVGDLMKRYTGIMNRRKVLNRRMRKLEVEEAVIKNDMRLAGTNDKKRRAAERKMETHKKKWNKFVDDNDAFNAYSKKVEKLVDQVKRAFGAKYGKQFDDDAIYEYGFPEKKTKTPVVQRLSA